MRTNIRKKLNQSIADLTLLCKQQGILQHWIRQNVVAWNEFVQALSEAQFDMRYGPTYSFKYRSGRDAKNRIVYWVDDLRGTQSREYLNAVRTGEDWDPNFPLKGLRYSAREIITGAERIGIRIPSGRGNAISRSELKRIMRKVIVEQSTLIGS